MLFCENNAPHSALRLNISKLYPAINTHLEASPLPPSPLFNSLRPGRTIVFESLQSPRTLNYKPTSQIPTLRSNNHKMPATSTLFRAARPAFRSQFFSSSQTQSQLFRTTRSRFQNYGGKRWQSTAAPEQSWAKKMWDSPIGVKTVHFWWVYMVSMIENWIQLLYGC